MIHNFNSTNYVIVLLLLVVLVVFVTPNDSLAQYSCINIQTDKSAYQANEIISVYGSVCEYIYGTAISIQVIGPNGNIIHIDQIETGYSDFSTSISTGGSLWTTPGTYRIYAQYGNANRNGETYFTLLSGPVIPKKSSISVEGTSFFVSYNINGGKILSITPDVATNSLIIAIEATNDGQLTITLPRALIDALLPDGGDDSFFVLVDGEESDFDETKTGTDRTLTVAFEEGAEEIEIIGTWLLSNVPPPSTKYHDVSIQLQVSKGSSSDSIKVYPTVTYDTGITLPSYTGSAHFSKIYVDGQYKILTAPNQWSSDFYIGHGYHEIYAESPPFAAGSEEFLSSSSNTVTIDLPPPPPSQDPTLFIILGVVAAIGGGIAVAAMMKSKSKPIPPKIPQPIPVPIKPDDTQFWVCPHCGKDTEVHYGRQYCPVCKIYL